MTIKLWILLVILSIIWGSSFFFNEIALTQLLPIQIGTVRICLAAVILAIFSTAVAYLLYFRILAEAGATNITLVAFLIPISAIFLGVIFLDKSLKLTAVAGMGLIFLGLLSMDGRLRQRYI